MPMITQEEFRAHVAAIAIPDGFTAAFTEHEGWYGKDRFLTYTLESPTIRIEFVQHGGGHTHYLDKGYWFNFDRTGVEDSFYHLPLWKGDEPKDLNALVAEQIERVAKQLAYRATAVKIPQIGFTVAPDGVEPLRQRLKKLGSLSFQPSGFGTGYTISKKRFRFAERVKPELEQFLGHSPLYLTRLDCD